MNGTAPAPIVEVFYPRKAPPAIAAAAGEISERLTRDLEQLPTESLERMWHAHQVEQAFQRFLANVKRKIGIAP